MKDFRQVTHFYRRSPDPEGWIQTTFITRVPNSDQLFYGQSNDEVPSDRLAEDIHIGSLRDLGVQWPIEHNETLWVSPDQNIFISDSDDPFEGRMLSIYKDNVLTVYDAIDSVVESKICSKVFNPSDGLLQSFYSDSHWKLLIEILLTKINKGIINKENFKYVGYVFAELHPLYKDAYRNLLEEHNVSYDSELIFMNQKVNYDDDNEWKIYLDIQNFENAVYDFNMHDLPPLKKPQFDEVY
jgi:hypothetical protein